MSLLKDLKAAVRIFLAEHKNDSDYADRASCLDMASSLHGILQDKFGYMHSGEPGPKSLYEPLCGHIWIGAGPYIVDVWSTLNYGEPPIRLAHSPEIVASRDYIWPGKDRGLLPTEVYQHYTYEEYENFYYSKVK